MRSHVQAYYAKCLQGDLPGAVRAIRVQAECAFSRKVNRRFVTRTEKEREICGDLFVSSIVRVYRNYYREALLHLGRKARAEKNLKREVRAIGAAWGLPMNGRTKWVVVEALLAKEFRRRGFYSLFGKVSPLLSLLVWRTERRREFLAQLVSGPERVNVTFLGGFVELGWLHYATFGRYYVGGWAKPRALFCVAQAYKGKFNKEAFRVSYLVHEAQHFSDYRKFPGLSQVHLEYRAKLAELSASKQPGRLLKKFKAEAGSNPGIPHSLAASRILNQLSRGSGTVQLRARKLLSGHSRSLAR